MPERFRPFCAVFLVLERDGKVLLQRRQGTGFLDGLYSLPGGHIWENETLQEALVREIQEELCLDVRSEQLRFAHLLHRIGPGDTIQYLDVFFTLSGWEGNPMIGEPDKSDELRWESIDNLPENIVEYMRQVLIAIKNGETYGEFGWEYQRLNH